MLLILLLIIPVVAMLIIALMSDYKLALPSSGEVSLTNEDILVVSNDTEKKEEHVVRENESVGRGERLVAITLSTMNIFVSLLIYVFHIFSTNQFQLVQEYHKIGNFDFYLGVDGLSIYFVILITIITPVALLSNWKSINGDIKSYLIIMLLLEFLLLTVFIVLDTLLFYIFFESILPPLFLLIGMFGSKNRVRASFYLFLYTLLGSLFLLLSILTILSILGSTDFDTIYKTNIFFFTQLFIFCGIFIAFAVKTPTIFLNTWLLKAHVESPLGGSIVLAAIVLKLSLYGILRLILPLLQKIYIYLTPMTYVVGVITILYASVSTLRTIDVKELIAYSSVSHAAVYLLGVFSNTIQGIEGAILLGLAHGFVSSGLFICTGGVLYDRSSTRLISFYRGVTQIMPLFSILFFILCLSNAGTPLSLNFIGEFLSLYGTFERIPLLGVVASSSIVFSAAYTIYMFNRIAFAGSFSEFFKFNLPDLTKREFNILLVLVILTVVFGIYPAPLLDGLHYSVSLLIYNLNNLTNFCDGSNPWSMYLQDSPDSHMQVLFELHDNIMFYLLITLFVATWTMLSVIIYYINKLNISKKYFNVDTIIGFIWTVTPALILILIAFPSFKLLYLMDEVTDPSLAIPVQGNKSYLIYGHDDFLNIDDQEWEENIYIDGGDIIYFFDPEAPGGEGSSSTPTNPQSSGNIDNPGSAGNSGNPRRLPKKFKADLIKFVYKVEESCADTSEELVDLAKYSKANVALELYNLSIELVNFMDKKALSIEAADLKRDRQEYKKESLERCQGVLLNTARQYACVMRDKTIHDMHKKNLDGLSQILSGINREVLTRKFKK